MSAVNRGPVGLPALKTASGALRLSPHARQTRRRGSRPLQLGTAAATSSGGGGGSDEGLPAAAGKLWTRLRSSAASLWSSAAQKQEEQPAATAPAAGESPQAGSGSVQQGGAGRSQSLTFRPDSSAGSSLDEMVEGHAGPVVAPSAPAAPAAAATAAAEAPPATTDVLLSWDAPSSGPSSSEPPGSGGGGEAGWAPEAGPPHPPQPWGRKAAGEGQPCCSCPLLMPCWPGSHWSSSPQTRTDRPGWHQGAPRHPRNHRHAASSTLPSLRRRQHPVRLAAGGRGLCRSSGAQPLQRMAAAAPAGASRHAGQCQPCCNG